MLLPPEQVIRSVIQSTALLKERLGVEIGHRPLVLPNGKFFPDKFCGDEPSVAQLMRRIQEHAGMTDVPIQTRIIGGEAAPAPKEANKHACRGDCGGKGCKDCDGSCHEAKAPSASNCASGCGSSCGVAEDMLGNESRLVDLGESWRVQVPANELRHPLVLTTNLARAAGYIFLVETQSPAHPLPPNAEAMADLVSTLLGFGGLLLGGAHIYAKSCGGPQIRRVTALGCAELAIATVLFAGSEGHDLRPLVKELEVTQKTALNEAEQWLKERPILMQRFASDPASLGRGDIPTDIATQGFFSRLFGKRSQRGSAADDPESSIAELEAMLEKSPAVPKRANAEPSDPHADELRALVDEAFAAHPGAQIQ